MHVGCLPSATEKQPQGVHNEPIVCHYTLVSAKQCAEFYVQRELYILDRQVHLTVDRREVHSVCSWDEKASVKIQKALEQEILTFIGDAQKV